MGLAHSPSVVMNGLVAYLDAGNSKGFDNKENIITDSEFVYTQQSGSTVATANQLFVPYGRNTAVNFNNNGGAGDTYIYRNFNTSLASGTKYVISVFSNSPTLVLGQGGLASGKFTQISSGSITLSNGWYRHWVSYSATVNNPNIVPQVVVAQGINVTLSGWQVETGTEITEYYPTTGTAKNRGTTFIDLSGNGNDGTLTNGPTYSSSNGGALVFDGTNDYVQKSSATINLSAGVTMEMIFKSTDMNSRAQGFMQFNTGGNYINFYTPGNGFLRWETWVPAGVAGGAYTTPTALSNNTWYHAVGTYSNGSSVLYINGNSVASASQTAGTYPSAFTANIRVGEYAGYMSGNIAIAKMYNRALSAAEVRQNFNAFRGRFGI